MNAVAVHPNGDRDIITGSRDNTTIIWTAESEQKRVLKGHTADVIAAAIHPNKDIVSAKSHANDNHLKL